MNQFETMTQNPSCLRVLSIIERGDSQSMIYRRLNISLSSVRTALDILEHNGLIWRMKTGRKHFYSLTERGLDAQTLIRGFKDVIQHDKTRKT